MPYALIALAAVLWGTIGPAARIALAAGMSPLEIACWRAVLAGACYAVHAVVFRTGRIARRDLPAVLIFALVGVTLFNWSYFRAVQTGGAALASVLLYTAPAWVAVAATWWLRETLHTRVIISIAMTLAGVGLVAASTGEMHVTPAAVWWGLLASFGYASYYLFGKRYFDRYAGATVFAYALPLGAVPLFPAARVEHPWSAWLAVVYIAVVPTYVAYLIYAIGLRRGEAARAATVATIEPVVAALLAYAMFREQLGALGYAGAALVLTGALLAGKGATCN